MPRGLRKAKPRAPKVPVRHLTVFLLREKITSIEDALDPEKVGTFTVFDMPALSGKLYVGPSPGKEPKWIGFVKDGVSGKLPPLQNRTISAALIFKVKKRLCAVTFGFGRYFLKPDASELDFGLKATLNTVDPTKLRSMDTRTFEEATVHTRKQASRSSPIDTFSVDTFRDVVGAVMGEPQKPEYGRRLAGRDALTVAVAVTLGGLVDYAAKLVDAYQRDAYKANFEWVDNIREVRDVAQIKVLDVKLVEALNDQDLGKMYLAPPEMLSSPIFPEFRYPGEGHDDEPHGDLDLEECLECIATREGVKVKDLKLTLEQIKKEKIRVSLPDYDGDFDRWSVYESIAFEFDDPDALYVLSAGRWFRVEKTYAGNIRKKLQRFVRKDVLPEALRDEKEEEYNARVAPLLGAALLDRKILKAEEAKSGIESCDLFLKDGDFVHVKRKTRSSTLSHLFSQGLVAGEVFLRDEKFRSELRDAVQAAAAPLAKLLPAANGQPAAKDYGVTYAVISRAKGGIAKELPFFSQVNFVRVTDRLAPLGYRVTLTHVPEK